MQILPSAGSSISAALEDAFSRSPCLFPFRTELSGLRFLGVWDFENYIGGSILGRKWCRRQLTEDPKVEITGCDLR
jgi:hypothetical protein